MLSVFRRYPAAPFYLASFSVAAVLILSVLLQHGMFMDGIQYACVSKNLAEGYGTFWFPFLSPFWCQNGAFHFFEHPPLFYWLESLCFRIPGTSAYAEKLFCGLMWLLNAFWIHRLWRLVIFDGTQRQHGWLPVLLWTATPVCFWCFGNNMIEILVSVFVLGAVYYGLLFLIGNRKQYGYFLLTALFLYGSFLTKGIVGLFPLSLFVIFSFTRRNLPMKHAVFYTLGLFMAIGIFCLIMCLASPSAMYSLKFYFKERLLHRIADTPTTNNRFELLFDLVSQLLPILIITVLIYGIQAKWKRLPEVARERSWFWFFLLLGFSGSLPIMLTMVQKGFYFMPSLAFFALAFSILIFTFFKNSAADPITVSYKIFSTVSLFMAVAAVVFCFFKSGTYSRDEALLKEVDRLGAQMPPASTINVDMPVYCTWNYQFYLQRYYRIYLDPTKTYRRFAIVRDDSEPWLRYYNLRGVFETSKFRLYEKKVLR